MSKLLDDKIFRFDDEDGLNYIIQSKLTSYEHKTIAEKFSIKSVAKGVEYYRINGEDYQLGSQNFIIVSPGQEIQVHIDSKSPVEGTCYFFENQLINQIRFAFEKSSESNLEEINPDFKDLSLDNIPVNVFYTLFENCIQTNTLVDFNQNTVSETLISLAELMVKHQSHTQYRLKEVNSTKASTKKELYKRLQIGRQFIHDNYQKSITLNEMSKAATLSEYYFHRSFREFFNITPGQYLNLVRMEKAGYLLNKGKNSKTEVAFACGFKDSKYFSKAYKKWVSRNL